MFQPYVLPLDDSQATLETVGGKGASLARLASAGLPVPAGFHVTTTAYRAFVAANDLQPCILAALAGINAADPTELEAASARIRPFFAAASIPDDIAAAVRSAYTELSTGQPEIGDRQSFVAVRSSATAEDLPEASFAGQQETFLNVRGADEVLTATVKCWASLWTARAIGYRARQGIAPESVALAAVVQLLVPAGAAGILFTAHPVTGRRDQVTISAAWGLGEAIVSGLVTPDSLTVDKVTGRVLERQIADKQVMTVRTEAGTHEQPVPEQMRRAPALDDAAAAELTRLAVQIEALYGLPVDIEWALADGHFAILQARPITALPPEPTMTVEWIRPNPKGQYMRGSIVDLLPNPVSPLFATLAIPAVARVGVKEVLRPLTRSEPDLPDDYITTINDYLYTGVAFTPHQWWWVLTRMMASFPRIMRQALPLWRDKIRPHYAATVAAWKDKPLGAMPAAELWAAIQVVDDAAMLHLASLLVATTGASAGSEMLFTRVYDKLIRRAGDPPAATLLMGYDSTPIRAEKSLYDLALWCRERDDLAAYLRETPVKQLVVQLADGQIPVSGWQEFRARLQAHLHDYGHIIYTLDYGRPLPLDDATPMLQSIRMYLAGEGVNPHERQAAAAEKRIREAEATLGRLRGLRRWAFRKTLGIAQTMAAVRENALADIGLGYPLLRQMLAELGRCFAQAGGIAQSEDIFWLEAEQVSQAVAALERGEPVANMVADVARRKARHAALKGATPPPTLPPRKRYMGVNMAEFTPAAAESQIGASLRGIGASAGRVTAPACVLAGPEDFGRMRPGDVLVAATTTPAWTPLFAMASAIVTDIGGPLSHGSIVAREYGVPAVMGTGVATRRIRSGQVVTVDGGSGTVTLTREA